MISPSANIEEFYILVDILDKLQIKNISSSAPKFIVEDLKYLIGKTLEVRMGNAISKTHELRVVSWLEIHYI